MSNGPVYDSPGALPEKDDFESREAFLEVYPDQEHLADIYFEDEYPFGIDADGNEVDEDGDPVTPPA